MKNNMRKLLKKERGLRDTLVKCHIDAEPSSYEEVAKKKEKENTSSRIMMSRMLSIPEENYVGYKEIFVARGFSRKEGINYEETFAATGR